VRAAVNTFNLHAAGLRLVIPITAILAAASLFGCSGETTTQDSGRTTRLPAAAMDKAQPQSSDDVLGVGDQLQLTVFAYPEFNSTTSVKPSGMIALPLIGEIKAAGLTKDQMQTEIIRRLSEYVKTKVYVTLEVTSSVSVGNIVVLGAVTAQNNFPRTSPVSIFQILASAGGPTTEADLGHVRVFRNGDLSREEELDLSGILTSGNRMGRSAPMVYPGDLVFVPRSDNFLKEFAPFAYNIVVVLTLFSFVK
jgi:polysaccharide export outer membrane protein